MLSSVVHCFGVLTLAWSWLTFDHYRPWVNFYSEALAYIGLTFLTASLLLRAPRDPGIPKVALFAAFIATVPWLQWVTGVSYFAGDATLASFYLMGLAIAISYGFHSRARNDEVRAVLPSFVHVLWLAAMGSAAIGLAQWLGVQDGLQMYAVQTDPGDRAMGNLGQPNQLATLLLIGIACYALAFERGVFGRSAFVAGIGFLSIVLLLTESRTGLLGISAMACFVSLKNHRATRRVHFSWVLAWAVSCLLLRLMIPYVHEALLLGTGRNMPLAETRSRWLIWQQVAAGIEQAPWFGYGWNRTPTAHAEGAIAFPGTLTYSNAHNIVLDLMAWNGVPLGLLLTLLGTYWLVNRAIRARHTESVYAIAALLPLSIHSMLEYPFAYGYFLVAAGLLIGLIEATLPEQKKMQIRRPWACVIVAVWAAVGAAISYEYLKVEKDFQIVRFENLNIGKTPADYVLPKMFVLSHMAAMLDAARFRPTPAIDLEELEKLRQVSRRFPYGAIAMRYALALGLHGDAAEASRQLAVIRGMYGGYYYEAVKAEITSLSAQYPQLRAVEFP